MKMRILIFTLVIGCIYGAPTAPEVGLCEVCHLLVGEVQDLLTTKQTQHSVIDYASDVCSRLPTEEKDVCNSFMKEHSGNLFDRLIKDLTPHEFCKSLTDVCPAYNEQPEAEPVEEADDPTANPLECELCKLAVLGIDQLIKGNRSSAAINSTLEKFCNGLPDKLKDVCIRIEPDILKGISQGFEPGVACKFARLCSAEASDGFSTIPCDVCYTVMDAIGVTDTESICASQTSCIEESDVQRKLEENSIPEVEDTLECQICKFAVQAIDTIAGENRSIAAINSTLENLCNSLPGELKDSCLNVEPDILKAVIGGIDPSKACDFLKICNDERKVPLNSQYLPCDVCKESMEAMAGEEGVKLCYKFKDVCGLEEPEVEQQKRVAFRRDHFLVGEEEIENIQEDAKCELCKFMIQLLDQTLEKNATAIQINNTLYEICNALPDPVKSACPLIIPQVEAGLAAGLDPTNTCIASDFCTETSRLVSIEELKCETCAKIVENLPDSLAVKVKNGVCKGVCHSIYRRSAEQGSELLYEMKKVIKETHLKGITECELCKIFIRTLDGLAGENASIETVNKTVFEICTRLTGIQLQRICLQDAPQLVTFLKAGIDPDKTCAEAKLCSEVKIQKRSVAEETPAAKTQQETNSMESALMNVIKEKERHNVGSLACDVCEGVIEVVDKLVEDNATDDQINQTLYKVCSGLPEGGLKDLCLQEVPAIMAAVDKGFDPKTICKNAGLCSSRGKDRNLRKKMHEEEMKTKSVESALLNIVKEKERHNVGSLACDVCEGVIEVVDKLVEDNATDDQINQTLYKVCSGLPEGGLKDLCLQEVPAIMAAVDKGFDPKTICKNAGLCSSRGKDRKLRKKMHEEEPKTNKVDSALLSIIEAKQKAQRNVGDIACDICEGVIELLDSVLEDNATDDKINQTLYNLCSGLPDGALKDLCIQEEPVIMATLEKGFDPKQTCSLAGLCNDGRQKQKIHTFHKQIKNFIPDGEISNLEKEPEVKEDENLKDLKCEVCEAIIDELDSVIEQNATIEKINQTVYDLCSRLPGALQDLCLQAAPQVVDALKNGVDPAQACGTIGLCSSGTGASFIDNEENEDLNKNVDDAKCEICTLIVQGIDELIANKASEEKINATIYGLCNELPGSAKSFCILVAPTIIKEIKGGVVPHTVCTVLKLCTSEGGETNNEMIENGGDVECYICEIIVEALDNLLRDNASDAKINATMFALCSAVPDAFKQFCITVAPNIVKAVESGIKPMTACLDLKLCTKSVDEPEISEVHVGDIKCDICELIIQGVDSIVGRNASDEKINATIYTLCDNLPDTAKLYCIKVAPAIVKELEGGVDPQTACTDLKLCTSSVDEVETKNLHVGDIKCDICELIIQGIDSIVGQNASDEKINATIYTLCNDLPGAAKTLCINLAPVIVKELEKGVDPQTACTDLKLCTSSVDEVETKHLHVGDIKCDICELIIQGIDSIVGQNASDEKINATIYTLCNDLPGAAKTFCINIAPAIVKEIKGGVDPQTACTDLKLCTSSADKVDKIQTKVGDLKCELCELIIHKLEQVIGQNASREKINSTIYKICNDLDGSSKLYCILLAPAIVKELESGVNDPEVACKDLKMCTTEAPTTNVISEVRKEPLDCNMCTRSLTAVYEDISDNYIKVEGQLLQICSNLPALYQDACEDLIQSDNGRMFKKVLANYTPTSLCEMAKCQEKDGPSKNHTL